MSRTPKTDVPYLLKLASKVLTADLAWLVKAYADKGHDLGPMKGLHEELISEIDEAIKSLTRKPRKVK